MIRRERNRQIQALRAVAAGLVLIYHAAWIDGGYIGVDIFYVISGFLITGLLVKELDATKVLSLTSFYARRIKRLLPASFLVVLVTAVAGYILLPASMRQVFGRDIIAASTYVSNLLFAHWQNDYQNLNSTPSPFLHFWSLAVEEQFYLLWPLMILLLFRIGRRRAVFIGVVVTFLSSFSYSLYLTEESPIWSFYILPTRAWELAAGALLVFLPELKRQGKVFALFSFSVIFTSAFIFNSNTPFPGWAALAPVGATVILISTRNSWPSPLDAVGNSRVVQWLGEVSYPLYLWHWPLLVIPALYFRDGLPLSATLSLLSLTIILAGLTHKFIERPIREKDLSNRFVLKLALLSTSLCIALGLIVYSQYSNVITLSDGTKYSLEDVRSKPVNDSDGCHIHRGETVSPRCEYGDTSSDRTIVLYGDSHAAQWLPAFDLIGKRQGIKIVSLTKSSCPSAEVIKELTAQYDVDDCQEFRDSSIARIKTIQPLAVVLAGMQPFYAPYSTESALRWWLAGEAKALDRINGLTRFPIYLTDTPLPQLDVPDCLAAGRKKACDTSRPISGDVAPGFIPINPTPWLCTETCPAVVNGMIAYRDKSHLTVEMSKHLSRELESSLARLGLF